MEDEIFDETKVDDRTDKEYEYLLFLFEQLLDKFDNQTICLLYTSPSPRDTR